MKDLNGYVVVGFIACAAAFVHAEPIVFTYSGTASGNFDFGNGESFTDAAFEITAYGDTDNRELYEGVDGFYVIYHDSATISIDGLGEFAFDFVQGTGTGTYINGSSGVTGLGRNILDKGDLIGGIFDPSLAGWDMLSSIGPILDIAQVAQWGDFWEDMYTDNGLLILEDDFATPIEFTATIVPAPSALALLGIAGLATTRRRR